MWKEETALKQSANAVCVAITLSKTRAFTSKFCASGTKQSQGNTLAKS